MTRRLVALLLLAGCFDPKLGDMPFKCGPQEDCPPGYGCKMGVCTRNGAAAADAPIGAADARVVDARISDAPVGDARANAGDASICASTPRCDGDVLVGCDGSRTTCLSGCDATSSPPACWILTPSNIQPDACDEPGDGILDLTAGPQALSTDSCTSVVHQLRGPDLCVMKYAQIIVAAGAEVTFAGARAPVLVATDIMQIGGILDVSAHGRVALGGSSADQLAGRGDDVATVGGGGGGHALRGGNSGETDGGAPIDDLGATPLIPGGWGGGAGCTDPDCTGGVLGGAGGGAIQIVACGDLDLGDAFEVLAGGGGGQGGLSQVIGGTGGAGGGAGGAILIEANAIGLGALAVISADGGGGGGGGGDVAAGDDGQDSANDGSLAPGGSGGDVTGGTGAMGNNDARAGMAGVEDFKLQAGQVSYGGAGGSAGRVQLNTRPDRPLVSTPGAIISPTSAQSTGTIGRHHR